MPLSPRSRRWLFRSTLLGGSVVMSMSLIEAGLRVVGFEAPVPVCPDPHRGYGYRPNLHWTQSLEGQASIRTNHLGFRDHHWTLEKPPGTVRVAVLGDSFVEALQVDESKRFTELLQGRMQAMPQFSGQRIEVMNFGLSGYGTAQELQTFRHVVKPFQPDYVVLSLLTANDIRNNSFALERDPSRPYFVHQNGRLTLDATRQRRLPLVKQLGITAAQYSRIGQVAWAVYQQQKARRTKRATRSEDPRDHLLVQKKLMSPGLSSAVYREPATDDWREAWSVTEDLLGLFRNEVEAADAKFLVVVLANDIQVDPSDERRRQFMDIAEVPDLLYPDHRIEDLCDREGIPVLPLAPFMGRYTRDRQTHLHGFANTTLGLGHWNEEGHQVASDLLARWFEESSDESGIQLVSGQKKAGAKRSGEPPSGVVPATFEQPVPPR